MKIPEEEFEGQDVLIPWVKPEVKGNAPRKSASLSSEPDNEHYRSRSSSCGGKNLDRPTCGRRQRTECRLISDGEKHRSKSLGDESTARDVYRSFSIASGHCGGQTIVEVDQGVDKAHKCGVARQNSDKLENTASISKSNRNSVNEEEGEDLKVSKWPGQLVSECKKLGKFLRSLSNKSISLDDGQADQQDVGENKSEVHNNVQPFYDTDLQNRVSTIETNDTHNVSRGKPLLHQKYHTEDTGNMNIKQLHQYKHPQDNYNSLNCPDLKMSGSDAVGCSYVNTPSFVSSGSCQLHYNNAAVTTSSDAITYHDVLSSCAASDFTDAAVYSQSPSTLSGLKYTLDSELVSRLINMKNAQSLSSQETSCPLSQTENLITSRVTEHVNDQPTLIRNHCSDEIKADIFKNHTHPTHPLCDNDIEAPSESWTTVSMSESLNSEDLVPSYSDTTILESQFSSNTNIPDHRSANPQGLPSTHEAYIRLEEAPKTSLDDLTDTTACVPMGIIYESANVLDMNKCLPKCHNKFHNVESQSTYLDHKQLVEKTRNSGPNKVGTFAAGIKSFSDVTDYTDHISSCSALSLDSASFAASTVQHTIPEATSECHLTKNSSSSLDNNRREKGHVEITLNKTNEYVFDNEEMVLQATKRMTINDERRNLSRSASSKEQVPSRGTLKNFISKLASYFRPHSKTGSIKFGHYRNGNSVERKFPFESESSDIETSVSSFSTHSSCYPGLFAMSKERDNCEQTDYIGEVDPQKYYSYDDDFEIINDTEKQVDDNRTNTEREADELKLNINVLNEKQNFRQDFVNDVSMAVAEHSKDTSKNVVDDPYVFKVENISQVPLRKASFLNNLSQKWSGMFVKRPRGDSRKACLQYSTASPSSSSDGNEERLKISLTDTEASSVSKYPPHKRPLVRRPNSLDFTKKRTRRGGGRRPAPQKEKHKSKDLERVRQFQEKVRLSLSDAMTLLGDGVAEENIIKRLDMPARTVFAEMKRINFAMRKFPMSSLGNSSSSKEDIHKEAEHAEKVPDKVTNARHLTMKMLRNKKLLNANRGFSESIGAQDVTKSRRQHFMENKEVPGIDLTNVPCLDKKCISEDFGISFDMLGGQIHKSKCQLLYSCNSDSREDLSALLESSSERQQDPRRLRNRTNNAQVAPEDLISFDTFEDFQQGTAITHNATELLDRDIADTKNISLSKYETRTNEHRPGIFGLQSNNTPWQCSQEENSFDEVSEATNILNKDGCSKMGSEIKMTYPNASSGKKLPLKAIDLILKPRQTRRTNKHRIPDHEHLTESKTDNSLSRYYHVFKKGELDLLVTQYVPSLRIVDTFYDHANWCVIAEKLTVP